MPTAQQTLPPQYQMSMQPPAYLQQNHHPQFTHNPQQSMSHVSPPDLYMLYQQSHSNHPSQSLFFGRNDAWAQEGIGLMGMNDFPPHLYDGTYPPDGIGKASIVSLEPSNHNHNRALPLVQVLLQSGDKINHKVSIKIYLSDLSIKKAWPDSFRHARSTWCTELKNHIYESLHLWRLIPSPDECVKMNPTDIQEYTKKAITEILNGKEYICSSTNVLGTKAHFSNLSYHTIMLDYWFSPKSIACCFPHEFQPHFSIKLMALNALLAEIVLGNFDPITDDSDIKFSPTLLPWLYDEMEDSGTGSVENQGISDDWQADALAEAGPNNFNGAWQSDDIS
ncbi:hypothetical protein PILCRDRAFT_91217 [Piloderma croceum F 1598]|uniref:DUF6532 domain-containing protein n=1 Tax=Piloderma croceum (strain F 1598) TaxID=765440 RepID=A0A0C3FC64_PILCF|nr:hypothetical protein PILCRDRAFT_91217 [Piloderma croceum F 1598]